jgi:predicted AlkP superfamily phosphohydrolase/phosphomutase
MGTTWKKIKKGMSEGFQNLSEKTGEMTQIGRLKIEIIAVKRDIEKTFIELGGRVYHNLEEKHEDDILSDQRIKKLVKDIKALELKLRTLEEKIEQVREHRMIKSE